MAYLFYEDTASGTSVVSHFIWRDGKLNTGFVFEKKNALGI
jgi:hypothetical protein